MANGNATARNWAALGIVFVQDTVAKGTGTNKIEYRTKAELPTVGDWEKFVEHFGAPSVLNMLNASNSIRVGAQAICRDLLERNANCPAEEMREAVYAWMKGVRGRSAQTITVTVVKRYLVDGSLFEGSDEMEWRQANIAALVEMGLDADKAIAKVESMEWKA